MGVKRLPKTDEFVAINEIGNCVLIVEYTEIIGTENQKDGHSETSGMKHYLAASNEKVEINGDGTHTIRGKNILLKRLPYQEQ